MCRITPIFSRLRGFSGLCEQKGPLKGFVNSWCRTSEGAYFCANFLLFHPPSLHTGGDGKPFDQNTHCMHYSVFFQRFFLLVSFAEMKISGEFSEVNLLTKFDCAPFKRGRLNGCCGWEVGMLWLAVPVSVHPPVGPWGGPACYSLLPQ